MLTFAQSRTMAASAIDAENTVKIFGIIPESNWGGLEISNPQLIDGEEFILYRMNCGVPDKWHRAKIKEARKGYYFVAYGRRRYLSEILRVPSLRIPRRY